MATDLEAAVRAAFFEEAEDLLQRITSGIDHAARGNLGEQAESRNLIMRALHTLKGAAAASGFDAIKDAAHAFEEDVRALDGAPGTAGHAVSDRWYDRLEALRRLTTPPAPAEPTRPEPKSAAVSRPASPPEAPPPASRAIRHEVLRVRPEKLDALHDLVGDLVIAQLQQESLASRLRATRDLAGESQLHWKRLLGHLRAARRYLPESSRTAIDAAGQALQASLGVLAQESQGAAREAPLLTAQTQTITASLEEGLRDLRLMPVQPFFEEFASAAREAARTCGKRARLEVVATDAEVDRAVLVRMREPLLHLVRNAVVHGIEDEARRQAAGKPETGVVRLEAVCEGAKAVIRVIDDGAGVDREVVRRKAVERQLIDAERKLDDAALLDVLTHPGFSTRETVDDLAGRGVGLDAVANAVLDVGGRLELDTFEGGGSIFTLSVPISASTSLGLTIKTADQHFGLLMRHIERVMRITGDDLRTYEGGDAVMVNGDPVALISLRRLLDLGNEPPLEGKRTAVLLRHGRQRLLLLVDDVPGEQAMVIKPLGKAFAESRLFMGGAVQADSGILPVLDAGAVFERATGQQDVNLTARKQAAGGVKKRVLVADDSITMRTLVRNILQAVGFDVTVAHDGQAALEALEKMESCDLLVTDLQMPRLDGIGLCRGVRTSRHPNLPIIMVTSVNQPEEKRLALESGADAYLVKGDFEQGRFLDQVVRFTGGAT